MLRLYLLIFILIFSNQSVAKEWAFDVYLDKNKIGTHTFILNDLNELTSRAKFNVKVLFIDAYTYSHISKEKWQDDCLSSIEANTQENKVITKVTGSQNGDEFDITNGIQSKSLPSCVMTFAYWNPKVLSQTKLLNPQNSEYLNTKIEKIGSEDIQVKGNKTETTHYLLQGLSEGKIKLNIDLWYDSQNNWVALQSTTPEGYKISYKLK